MSLTEEQIDDLDYHLARRHLDEVLNFEYLNDARIDDPRLRRLVKAYMKITKQLKKYLHDQGVYEGTSDRF